MADKKKRVQNLIARNLSDIIIYEKKIRALPIS